MTQFIIKYLLFLPSKLYCFIVEIRNYCFDNSYFHSQKSELQSVLIGNVTVGGTGKSPHVRFLVDLFENLDEIAVLSRGYGRKTKGFYEVNDTSTAFNVGDEPLALYQNYNKTLGVFVCENRVNGEKQIIENYPSKKLLILDDGFQHRAIKADINIVLIDYNQDIFIDNLLPMGRLREPIKALKRAQIIILTKCPIDFSLIQKNIFEQKIKAQFPHLKVFFSTIAYQQLLNFNGDLVTANYQKPVLAIAGLSQPKPFFDFCIENFEQVKYLAYKDHYNFNEKDMILIKSYLNKGYQIICTEKDKVKLKNLFNISDEIYYIPIGTKLLFHEKDEFKLSLTYFMNKNSRKLINFEGD